MSDFCQENGLMILNTLFKQHPRRLYTWLSPDGSHRNEIDYILVQKRWRSSFTSPKTYPEADCGSDHQLFVSTMEIKLPRKPVRFDLTKLDDAYRVEVKNKFQKLIELDPEATPDELWQDIKFSTQQRKTSPNVRTKEDPGCQKRYLPLLIEERGQRKRIGK